MAKVIKIKYSSQWDEYNVPNTIKDDDGYYTSDKDDAIATAKHMHGKDIEIKIVRGK